MANNNGFNKNLTHLFPKPSEDMMEKISSLSAGARSEIDLIAMMDGEASPELFPQGIMAELKDAELLDESKMLSSLTSQALVWLDNQAVYEVPKGFKFYNPGGSE